MSTITRVWNVAEKSFACIATATHAARNAFQCKAKSIAAKTENVAKSKKCAWVLLAVYISLGTLGQIAHLVPANMPWSPMLPISVQASVFDMCAAAMTKRRVTPVHLRSLGSNLNVVCTPQRVLFNPYVTSFGIVYTNALGQRAVVEGFDHELKHVVIQGGTPLAAPKTPNRRW